MPERSFLPCQAISALASKVSDAESCEEEWMDGRGQRGNNGQEDGRGQQSHERRENSNVSLISENRQSGADEK